MPIKQMYDIKQTGYPITGYTVSDVSSSAVQLPFRLFYEDGLSISHGSGDVLTTADDYSLADLDDNLTTLFGKNVYKSLYITNINYQTGTLIIDITGVGDILLASDVQTLQSEINARFNASVGGPIEGNITVRDILPNMTGATGDVSVRNIGSETQKFNSIYADEVFVGASSLYVNGKKVVEDVSDIITFTTDVDQGLSLKTVATAPGSGNGNIAVQSDNEVNVIGRGGVEVSTPAGVSNKNIVISNASTGGQIQLSASDEIDLTASVIDLNGPVNATQLTVAGDLIVEGTTTTIDTQTVTITDNIVELNTNQTGTPASTLVSGIQVNRGDLVTYRFVFREDDDTFIVGEQGLEQAVATRQDSPVDDGIAFWDSATRKFNTFSGLTYDGVNLSASQDVFVKSRRVVTVASGTEFPTSAGLGDECYRTDLDEWYKYNGSVWMQI